VRWLSENRHWLIFAGFVLSGLGTVGVAIVGFVATLTTLLTEGSVVATLGTFLLGALGLGGLSVVFAVALLATLAKRASSAASNISFPTSERAAGACHHIERAVPPLARFRLGDRFAPSVEERRAELTERYVTGDLSEAELEAELAELLDDHPAEPVPDSLDHEVAMAADADREVETET
jgi:hypothetical protein